nr:unnamed protein product [Digitaria exilis]
MQLLNLKEIRERRLTDPRFPAQYRNLAAKKKSTPWPIEMRFCEDSASQHKPRFFPQRISFTFSVCSSILSDLLYSGVSLNPYREKGLKTYSLSLDHSCVFCNTTAAIPIITQANFIESPSAHGGWGFITESMFNRQGELIMSLTQEALIRREKTRPNPRPKL